MQQGALAAAQAECLENRGNPVRQVQAQQCHAKHIEDGGAFGGGRLAIKAFFHHRMDVVDFALDDFGSG